MKIGADLTALGGLVEIGAEAPRDPGEQLEFLFAQQLLQALTAHGELSAGREAQDYLGMLSEHLAREIAKGGGLGIGRQLSSEASS